MSKINKTAHGLVAGQRVSFSDLVGGVGIDVDTIYFVVPVINPNDFQIAETDDGTPITFTTLTSANMIVVPETTDEDTYDPTYTDITDPGDAMAPPLPVPTPPAPTVESALVSGIVRLQVTLNSSAEEKVRNWEVQITHNFISAAPDWTTPSKHTLPEGSTTLSIPALGGTVYAVRVAATDVYGNVSAFSSEASHTTVVGSDALSSALALLSNDVSDGVITETKIADDSITTPKVRAKAITADLLASTIVLSSLFMTDVSPNRRVEFDASGIRLYDNVGGVETLIVNIPTNGDPVYVAGRITASSLLSQTEATLYGSNTLPGSSVTTLANGIAAPTNSPTLTASVDSLTLTGTGLPASAIGIGRDATAGTYWVAVDPASGYVAYEYNATTGAFVRRIAATGSTTIETDTEGSTSHVSDTAQSIAGSTNSHIATPITLPAFLVNPKITKVSVYLAGVSGTCDVRNAVWSTSGNNLGESSTYAAASKTFNNGNSVHYDKSVGNINVTAGGTYWVGFRRTNTSDTVQFDRDDGAGKTTKSADGTSADGTGWGNLNTASKINVYVTYTHEVDTRLETAPMIGVATDGSNFIWTLDTLGQVWEYNRTTLAYIRKSGVQTAITGTKSKAGLFYDATAGELIITTSTGTGAGVYPKFVRVNTSTLAVSSSVYSAAAGTTFSGTTDTFRGGARVNDPLNASAATYWVATTSKVYAYTFSGSTATQTSNRDFGTAATVGDGLLYDSSIGVFLGFDAATPTKIWEFTDWDFTTASTTFWCGYSWYDQNSSGGTHETAMGPVSSITIRRRERVFVTNATIPTGGVDDPNRVRVYALQNATNSGAGTFWLQDERTGTGNYLTLYLSSGTHDGTGTAFPAGTPAVLKDAGSKWQIKGDGSVTFDTTVTPGGKPPEVTVYTSGSGSWSKPAGLSFAVVEVQGGGGGSGGVATTGVGEASESGGGGGGGFARKVFTASALSGASSFSYAVGGGGSAGSAGANNGGAGGNSTFSGTGITTVQGNGGGGGGGNTAGSGTGNADGGAGGSHSGGDFGVEGGGGGMGRLISSAPVLANFGGNSHFAGIRRRAASVSAAGVAGNLYGGGAAGASNAASQSSRAGAAGGAGIVVVTAYFGS